MEYECRRVRRLIYSRITKHHLGCRLLSFLSFPSTLFPAYITTLNEMRSFTTFFTSSPLRLISLALTLTSITAPVQATPALAFDSDFNLYAFGFSGKDYQLGTQDKWGSSALGLLFIRGKTG